MKTLSLKLPDALDAQLAAEVRRQQRSKSEIVRLALEAYFTRSGEPPPGSFLELAKDICGCVEGPADLSSGKEHMEGYGR